MAGHPTHLTGHPTVLILQQNCFLIPSLLSIPTLARSPLPPFLMLIACLELEAPGNSPSGSIITIGLLTASYRHRPAFLSKAETSYQEQILLPCSQPDKSLNPLCQGFLHCKTCTKLNLLLGLRENKNSFVTKAEPMSTHQCLLYLPFSCETGL